MIAIEAERFEAIGLQVKNPEIGARPAQVFCGQIIDSNGGVFWLQQGADLPVLYLAFRMGEPIDAGSWSNNGGERRRQ